MKKIIVKESNFTDGEEHTYYVTFHELKTWSYTFRATQEGMGRCTEIWKLAGYEIEYVNMKN